METPNQLKEGDFYPPRKSAAIDAILKLNPDHPLGKEYLEKFKDYSRRFNDHLESAPKKKEIILPELKPIDPESLYNIFKENYPFVAWKIFDETVNGYESRKLARTIISYLINHKSFFKSPLLNYKSEPSFDKGLLIIGSFGIGKTSILETFHKIFKYAQNNGLHVKDKEGTWQLLGRYNLYFGFNTANEVVREFEGIKRNEEDIVWKQFWKKHSYGFRYYDDIMTERTASNFGKVELFKDILEERYSNKAKTMTSVNYAGQTVETTLDAIAAKYGERVYDRLFEMFNIIELKGETLRK